MGQKLIKNANKKSCQAGKISEKDLVCLKLGTDLDMPEIM